MPPHSQQSRRQSGQAASGNGRGRVAKRSCNACARCRRQKIKCSGSQPCEACSKRKLSCEFDERDQKILVTRGYIIDLERKLAYWERSEGADGSTPGSVYVIQDNDRAAEDADSDAGSARGEESGLGSGSGVWGADNQSSQPVARLDPVTSTLTNPLSTGPSQFIRASDGRPYYLGTSSNWSFTRRVLSMTHEYIYQAPVPTTTLLFDGVAYDLKWDGYRTAPGLDTPALPTLDYAIFLINAVKFHCSQTFHLFDEESFMRCLYDFYSDPTPRIAAADLWYIHFLAILAFGKAFTTRKANGNTPPGADFFLKAIQLLPEMNALVRQPLLSAEILCCISLYFQCLDYRHAAHNYIGIAMRLAMFEGMHTDMPVQHLGEAQVERCRRAWWTIYVLDREMTSLMGLPQSIHDDDVHPDLPTFSGSVQRAAALSMQIKLSRVIAKINRGVYGANGRLNSRFLLSTKEVLAGIAGLADELRSSFPLHLDNTISGISRTSAHLHLLYHQCIVLATRPLLFCFLKIRFESQGTDLDPLNSSQTAWNLIKMCIDSSQQMINILNCLQAQGLLETFLPFDLQSISVSTVNLLLAPAVDPQLLESRTPWLEKAYAILDDMAASGNVVANFQRDELRQLDEMLGRVSRHQSRRSSAPFDPPRDVLHDHPPSEVPPAASLAPATTQPMGNDLLPSPISGILDELTFNSGLTTAQIMDTANSIESCDTEWMSQAILEHSIW